ncbi:hypothetical protein CHLRE_06g278153v5 [Chlamydomonas reinhardtii]|uniref:Peptidase M11 gametolysin domain-containing protein n=1 Tax=Chlamydomonas reinhardtii TaxID=3055 RepID=A0A2K3DP06_CHLRE|nr:uncharacterized protein CHLRE_06g278153v5 [Chlamydomonas reinhardtii]PNW82262.1 hypothetical protein CHLRE_06g278153v5 [Chlamydomonas reinhardtii]
MPITICGLLALLPPINAAVDERWLVGTVTVQQGRAGRTVWLQTVNVTQAALWVLDLSLIGETHFSTGEDVAVHGLCDATRYIVVVDSYVAKTYTLSADPLHSWTGSLQGVSVARPTSPPPPSPSPPPPVVFPGDGGEDDVAALRRSPPPLVDRGRRKSPPLLPPAPPSPSPPSPPSPPPRPPPPRRRSKMPPPPQNHPRSSTPPAPSPPPPSPRPPRPPPRPRPQPPSQHPPSPSPPLPSAPSPSPPAPPPAPSDATRFSLLAVVVSLCGRQPAVRPDTLQGYLLGPARTTLQSYTTAVSNGMGYLDPSAVAVAPGVVDVPCSGFSSGGPWGTGSCGPLDQQGWSEYVVAAVAARWGLPTGKYGRLMLVLPPGNACGVVSWGTQSCAPDFIGWPLSRCYVIWTATGNFWPYWNVMHEMLHNKGLFHSIRDNSTDPYGDGSCIMGSGYNTCLNVAQMARLNWATPLATLGTPALPANAWQRYSLPAHNRLLANHIRINPGWLAPSPLADPNAGALFVSYRVRSPSGCDTGLDDRFHGRVQLHSYIDTLPLGSPWRGNVTVLVANVGPRQLWPPAGRRNLGPSSLQLALRVVSRSPLTDAVPRVTLELCRYTRVTECV